MPNVLWKPLIFNTGAKARNCPGACGSLFTSPYRVTADTTVAGAEAVAQAVAHIHEFGVYSVQELQA